MPVTITIMGETANQALAELMGLSHGVSASPAPAPTESKATLQAEPVPDSERKVFPPEQPPEQPPRRTRTKKAAELEAVDIEPAPKQEPEVAAEPEAPFLESDTSANAESPAGETKSVSGTATAEPSGSAAPASPSDGKPEFTEDDARRALIDLGAQANGKEKCRAVLTKFGATKLSEIPAEKRKEFIAEIARERGIA